MIAQLKKKTEIKIYILYVMKNIGYPLEYEKLNDTVIASGAVNYFGFAECFSELVETGNIATAEGEKFIITEQGINVVDNLLNTLIPSVQRAALAAATRLTSFEKRGASVDYRSVKLDDGRYRFEFWVTEYNEKIFTLSIVIKNEEQKRRIEYNLSKNPDSAYKAIMALLSGQADYLLNDTI